MQLCRTESMSTLTVTDRWGNAWEFLLSATRPLLQHDHLWEAVSGMRGQAGVDGCPDGHTAAQRRGWDLSIRHNAP
jgi:hypothetical protein